MLQASKSSKKSTQIEEDLRRFPPILRKVALQMVKSDRILNVSQAAREAGLSPKSVKVATYRERKKGNDFDELKNRIAYQKLTSQKPLAYEKLMEGVQKSSHRHLELYFTLIGDLKKEPKSEGNTTTNSLTFVLSMPESIPQPAISEHNGTEDQDKVIDVQPESPSLGMIEQDHNE
jgi:hypothetical protein